AANVSRRRPHAIVGVNIGKSRRVDIDRAIPDYLASFEKVFPVADYIAINVSSPNTPNLRELQRPEMLADLLSALQTRNTELARPDVAGMSGAGMKPLLLKIAPDLSINEIEAIVDVAMRAGV